MGRKERKKPRSDACSDVELMQKLAAGDAEPLGQLFLRYGKMVHSVLRRYATGLGEAEIDDMVQEVFLTLFESAPRYQESGKLRSWLCGIAVRKARSGRRKHWLRDNLLRRFGGGGAGTAAMREGNVESQAGARVEVTRALAVLPKPQREVLLLHVVEDLSGEEIAEALGISPKTVWTRLHRARQTMRAALEEAGDES